MNALARLEARARHRRHHLLLVGDEDAALVGVAAGLAALGPVTVVGAGGIRPAGDPRLPEIAMTLRARWPERVRDGIHALDLAAEPLLFAAGLLLAGEGDILLAGPALASHVIEEAYRWILGPDRATRGRGSIRYLLAADGRLLTTVTPDTAGPLDARGVARIALAAANHRHRALDDQPRVAFLVPPPAQDASHADAELALGEFHALAPGIQASVEWAWTAADPAPEAPRFRARPNVLIFPDPVSGHLAHGLLRDATAARIWGPVFPDERWAVVGLPDGALADDIVAVASVAAAGIDAG